MNKKFLKKILINFVPYFGKIIKQRDILLQERNDLLKKIEEVHRLQSQIPVKIAFPPGHFYSPIPSLDDINRVKNMKKINTIFEPINFNEKKQLLLLKRFAKKFLKDLTIPDTKRDGFRYFYNNPNFSYADAISLYFIIRYFKPKKIIEVGSGFSSALMLDINEMFFKNKIDLTFIEPFPELLNSLIKKGDKINLIKKPLQDVDAKLFKSLNKNDLLFIDSTHVSKAGSDVNKIFFEILPILNKGVIIHFHDIFYPFEYLIEWLEEGRFWNEIYIFRAFMQYNNHFKIIFFNRYLWYKYKKLLIRTIPLFQKNPGGSIYIRKT